MTISSVKINYYTIRATSDTKIINIYYVKANRISPSRTVETCIFDSVKLFRVQQLVRLMFFSYTS